MSRRARVTLWAVGVLAVLLILNRPEQAAALAVSISGSATSAVESVMTFLGEVADG